MDPELHLRFFSNRSLAASPDETRSKVALRADVDVINATQSDPRVQVVLARAGDSDDPPGPDGAAEVAGPLAPENPLLEFSGLANGKRSSASLVNFCGRGTAFASVVWPLRLIGPSCLRAAFLEQPCHMSWCR